MPVEVKRPEPCTPPLPTSITVESDYMPHSRRGWSIERHNDIECIITWRSSDRMPYAPSAIVNHDSVREFAYALLEMVGD